MCPSVSGKHRRPKKSRMYEVTKTFSSGPLKGLTITERTTVRFEVGKIYTPGPFGGLSIYTVTKVEPLS